MDLSVGAPGHCPGFIPKLCQRWSRFLLTFHPLGTPFLKNLFSYISTNTAPQCTWAVAHNVVSHGKVHCCNAYIQTSSQVKKELFLSFQLHLLGSRASLPKAPACI